MPTGYNFINHVVSMRLRLSGSGNFLSRLAGLEDTPEKDLATVAMQTGPSRPVSLLSNIKSTRLQYHGYTEEIDEYFVIKNITFFTKPTATGYPQ